MQVDLREIIALVLATLGILVATPYIMPTGTPAADNKPQIAGLPNLIVGNPAENGALRRAQDGAFDSAGNLYILDSSTLRASKFNPQMQFVGFIAPQSGFATPIALTTSVNNSLYVAYNEGFVIKYDAAGKDTGKFGDSQFGMIYSLAADAAGNIYTLTYDRWLVKYDPAGIVIAKWQASATGSYSDAGYFDTSSRVRVDAASNIYLLDFGSQFSGYGNLGPACRLRNLPMPGPPLIRPWRVQRFTPDFSFVNFYDIPKDTNGYYSFVYDVLPDSDGGIYVAGNGNIWHYNRSAQLITTYPTQEVTRRLLRFGNNSFLQISQSSYLTKLDEQLKVSANIGSSNARKAGQFENANKAVVDSAGNFYVAEGFAGRIQKFDAQGKLLMTRTPSGLYPFDLSLDKSDNLYVISEQAIYKYSPDGKLLLSFGSYGDNPGQFKTLTGVAIDQAGNIYTGDAEKELIQKFSPNGSFLASYSLKDSSREVITCMSLAFDKNGNLYIGFGNRRGVQVLDQKGKLTTLSQLSQARVTSLAIDEKGTLYALSYDQELELLILTSNGQVSTRPLKVGTNQLEFLQPSSIAVDRGGNLYISEEQGARVQRWK